MAATIKIIVQDDSSGGGLGKIKQDIESLDASAGNASGGGLGLLGGALKTIGGVALGVAAGGIAAFGAAMMSGIADAQETAQLMAQTQATITSTGGAAGVSAQQVADFASSLSDAAGKSLFGDDLIQGGENLLLTFTNIQETLPDATTTMVDMSQALGQDMKSSAMQLGKALNDPIQGISALSRVGVTFTDQQKDQIKAMQDAGDTAGAQRVILAELNREFGGSAEAAAKATGGWSQFKGRMGEASEAMGAAVLPLLNSLAGVLNDKVAPFVENAVSAFAGLVDAIQDAGVFSTEAGEALGYLATQLGIPGPVIDGVKEAVAALHDAFVAITPAMQAVTGFVRDNLQPALAFVQPILHDLGTIAMPLLNAAVQIGASYFRDALVPALNLLWSLLTTVVLPAIAMVVHWLAEILPPAIKGVADFLTGTLFPAFHTVIDWITANVVPILANVVQWLGVHVPIAAQKAADFWTSTLKPALEAVWSFIQTNVIPIISSVVTWLGENVPIAAQKAADFWNNTLKPALAAVWSFIQDNVIPILQDAAQWVGEKVVAASRTLSTFWTGTLKPALNAVWSFIQDYVIPVFKAVANVADAVLGLAIRTLSDLWTGTLKPALEAVWKFIQDNVSPIFTSLSNTAIAGVNSAANTLVGIWNDHLKPALTAIWNLIKDNVQPVIEAFTGPLGDVKDAFNGIRDSIGWVIGKLNDLADKIRNMPHLPSAFNPGSPTPAEMGFRGIAAAVAQAQYQISGFNMAVRGMPTSYISNTNRTLNMSYAPHYSTTGAPMNDVAVMRALAGV